MIFVDLHAYMLYDKICAITKSDVYGERCYIRTLRMSSINIVEIVIIVYNSVQ